MTSPPIGVDSGQPASQAQRLLEGFEGERPAMSFTAVRDRVLLVEDEASLRSMYRRRFEAAGFDVVEAGVAADGIAALTQASFDMVVIDVRLSARSIRLRIWTGRTCSGECEPILQPSQSS